MYKSIIRPLLFLLDPERAHHLVFSLMKFVFGLPFVMAIFRHRSQKVQEGKEVEVMGIRFPNRVGLAAGFDKDALLYEELSALGFGFIEVGTVTPLAQDGNPKPRMFRLTQDRGLINRMGFNNAGVESMKKRLQNRNSSLIIGGNIGKNKATPNDQALNDYLICMKEIHALVDYFVVNVSSPNTPGLRELQDKEPLTALLNGLMQQNRELGQKPLLLKIAPDLSHSQLDDIIDIVRLTGIQGIVATNTTLDRSGLKSPQHIAGEAGGLSGAPLKSKSTEIIRYLREKGGPGMTIIGVGGIFSAQDAEEKLEAGADLIQVYTGFIYQGPGLIHEIIKYN